MGKKNTKKSETNAKVTKPKRERTVRSKIGQVAHALALVVDGDRKAAESAKTREIRKDRAIGRLRAWGKIPDGVTPNAQAAALIAGDLLAEGFEPPKGTPARTYAIGDLVQLREKAPADYRMVYSNNERGSMVVSEFDAVTKTIICRTCERQILTKAAHIERREPAPAQTETEKQLDT